MNRKKSGKKFENKTLLMLGSNAGAKSVVGYARENGAHVIVADYLPPEESPAKLLADEDVLISTADTDSLEKLVIDREVDAVFSGVSEFNILKAMEVAEKCGLRFYCTREQWDSIEIKDNFRKLCSKFNVPCPATYYVGTDISTILWDELSYPVVVKPVDCGASMGVHICHTFEEAKLAVVDAKEKSDSGRVIIEQFCVGHEFTAHYVVHKGEAALSCIDNRYPVALHEGAVTTIPVARVYPSLFADDYIESVDANMKVLVESLGMTEGVLFIQGLYDEENKSFAIFEAGLRSAAECPFRFIEYVTGLNYMKLIVDYLLLGSCEGYDLSLEDPTLAGKCCGIISFAGKHGVVAKTSGIFEEYPGVVEVELRYPVGSEIPDTDTLRQLALRYVMVCSERDEMAAAIKMINQSVEIKDSAGKSLIVAFDPMRLGGLN